MYNFGINLKNIHKFIYTYSKLNFIFQLLGILIKTYFLYISELLSTFNQFVLLIFEKLKAFLIILLNINCMCSIVLQAFVNLFLFIFIMVTILLDLCEISL